MMVMIRLKILVFFFVYQLHPIDLRFPRSFVFHSGHECGLLFAFFFIDRASPPPSGNNHQIPFVIDIRSSDRGSVVTPLVVVVMLLALGARLVGP